MCLERILKLLVAGYRITNLAMAKHLLICDPSLPHRLLLRYGDAVVDLHQPQANTILQAMVELVGDGDWDGIQLVNKAESFTLIRVLATIANALAYSKGLQLYDGDQPVTRLVPKYSRSPL